MKKYIKATFIVTFMLITSLLLSHSLAIGSYAETDSLQEMQQCRHSFIFDFDDDTMTVQNVTEYSPVENLLNDINDYSTQHKIFIMHNGIEVTDGYLAEGMQIAVYHDDILYGIYTVAPLSSSCYDENGEPKSPPSLPSASTSTNQYGFILPLDGMNLTTNISNPFGGAGNHRGIDIWFSGINGKPVRAAKSGTVTAAEYHNVTSGSWGYYVKINHNDGMTTLYAHMSSNLQVAKNSTVSAGQIIGYVSSTGEATGPHLHLELTVNSTLKNPIPYLTGAPSYNGSSHYHSLSYTYEAAHPHRQYGYCSCGYTEYTGQNRNVYVYTSREAAHPHREYKTCSCGINEYTGVNKPDYVSTYYEAAHPHKIYRTCSCGQFDYTGGYQHVESCEQCE